MQAMSFQYAGKIQLPPQKGKIQHKAIFNIEDPYTFPWVMFPKIGPFLENVP